MFSAFSWFETKELNSSPIGQEFVQDMVELLNLNLFDLVNISRSIRF